MRSFDSQRRHLPAPYGYDGVSIIQYRSGHYYKVAPRGLYALGTGMLTSLCDLEIVALRQFLDELALA